MCRPPAGRARRFPNPKPRVPGNAKKDLANMENFAQLLEEYSAVQEMNQGEVITAEVVAIEDKFVIVNAGLKSESLIDINEFKNMQGEVEVKVGDFVTLLSNPWKTASAKPNSRAKKPNVPPTGLLWKKLWKTATSSPA